MGKYLNPGNTRFRNHLKNPYYVDKSGLIDILNNRIENDDVGYFCVSRPRRFGKSYVADMLTAYYSRGCDSRTQFDKLNISHTVSYVRHLNKYDLIYVDVNGFLDSLDAALSTMQALEILKKDILFDLKREYPNIIVGRDDLIVYLDEIYLQLGVSFMFIVDEWDAPFRINKNDADGQAAYLRFLNALFKGKDYVVLAYMTGILPIKKYATGSALNMFSEYTMLKPGPVREYIGFTETEVERLCQGSKFTANDIKDWYDGYNLGGLVIYNPYSVIRALNDGELTNYWTMTEAFEDLLSYIKMNVDGLHDVILKLLANERYVLSSYESFKNDLVNLESKNDYLVALVHLGYLSYNFGDGTLKIPNNEIRMQFVDSLGEVEPSVLAKYYTYSNGLLDVTLSLDAVAAAEMLGRMFSEFTIKTGYCYEDSFEDFIFSAYMSANDYYDVIHEAPTRWLKSADFVFYPNPLRARKERSYLPAVIIELKTKKSTKAAMNQITEKGYDDYFEYRGYHGDVIHVGLNFKKMTEKKKAALAKKSEGLADNGGKRSFGSDAGLDTHTDIVHFCELKKYKI